MLRRTLDVSEVIGREVSDCVTGELQPDKGHGLCSYPVPPIPACSSALSLAPKKFYFPFSMDIQKGRKILLCSAFAFAVMGSALPVLHRVYPIRRFGD